MSAGNGPLMRAPVLGVLGRDAAHVRALVDASTLMTHKDPRAVEGAQIAAALTRALSQPGERSDAELLAIVYKARGGDGTESFRAVERAMTVDAAALSVEEFARRECGERAGGVSGYVVHTLGCSVFAWRRHRGDARAGISAIVRCGGDTDSTAALVGALYGADGTPMPDDWASRVRDWPRSLEWIGRVGSAAAASAESGRPAAPPSTPPGACVARNVLLLGLVVGHIARRALPPY
jgi:ADP-ribosylglycohydrolase